jgi:protein-disulfide isomerase
MLAVIACRGNSNAGDTPTTGESEAAATAGAADGPDFGEDEWDLASSPLLGAENGLVTIVEFSDFECPFCGRVVPTLKQLVEAEEFAGKVRIVFKQMPLPMHANAPLAHQAALAAHAQGKFWEYHDLLFENQRALQRADLERYAEQLGLDMETFRAALDNEEYKDEVEADVALAGRLGIRGTPNFLVNGRAVTGARPYDDFASVVREEITAMEALIAEGKSVGEAYEARVATNREAAPAAAQPQARANEPDPNAEMYVPVEGSPFKGAEDALVTIVEFSEFQCPFCARVNPTIQQILDTYGDDVRVVFKQNPLSFHDRAEPAARASIAAHNQGKFWEYHDLLFANQRELTDANLAAWAEQIGLNMERFNADLQAAETTARIEEDQALAARLAARGTPHFFINGYRLRGAQPYARFEAVINERLTEARALVESGTPRAGVYEALQADAVRGPAPMIQAPTPQAQPQAQPAAPAAPVEINVGDAPAKGPADAPVTVVVWTDFQCPFCTRLANNLDAAIEGIEDKVRVVVKAFPLSFHQDAHLAHQASLAAHAQGKFWEFHDTLFANQRALGRADLERYAEQIGLDMDTFRAALDNGTYRAEVDAQMREGQGFGVTGTPGWFVNGVKFGGARPAEAIRAAIDEALAAE